MKNIARLTIISFIILTGCSQPAVTLQPTSQAIATSTASATPDVVVDFEKLEARVPILIYHHIREYRVTDSINDKTFIVSADELRQQFQYLKDNHFTSITFKNLVDYFNGQFNLPEKPVIISFDDGVINQYNNAFDLLKEFDFTATFFIFVNPIGKSKNYMTWEQLAELRDAGMEIGSHGWYHQYLTRINNDELERELVQSKNTLEQQLDTKVISIAYPFGDFNEQVATKIQEAGYLTARDIVNGINHRKQDLFRLKGYFITNDFSRFKLIVNKINQY